MGSAARPRPLAFIVVSAGLVVSGIVFSQTGGEGAGGRPSVAAGQSRAVAAEAAAQTAQRVAAETARLRSEVEASARRFLPAFFRYEAGDRGHWIRTRLRAWATREFATPLLAIPPRPPRGGFLAPARLRSLRVILPRDSAFQAFVHGSARREGALEQFSFEFRYEQGEWLASGVTE